MKEYYELYVHIFDNLLKLANSFFKLFLLYFTLQYCIGFAIHWHESTTGVYKLPILNPPSTSRNMYTIM